MFNNKDWTQKNAYTVKAVVNDNEMFLRIHECHQKFSINVVLLLVVVVWRWCVEVLLLLLFYITMAVSVQLQIILERWVFQGGIKNADEYTKAYKKTFWRLQKAHKGLIKFVFEKPTK